MPLRIPFKIETFENIPSTQDLMRERLERGDDVHGLVIRALAQSNGRGQRRRDWQSGLGGSYQTLAVKDEAGTLKQPFATIAIAVGLAQTLPEYGIQVGIKWPNDLHYPFKKGITGKKVAGILCEYVQGHLLAAVGMNVNNAVPETATSLRGLDTEGVSNFILAGMQKGLELIATNADVVSLFEPYDVLKDKTIELELNKKRIRGIAKGINTQGCLQIQTLNKLELVCHSSARSSLKILT